MYLFTGNSDTVLFQVVKDDRVVNCVHVVWDCSYCRLNLEIFCITHCVVVALCVDCCITVVVVVLYCSVDPYSVGSAAAALTLVY
jgi:hypothetical protein